MPNNPILMQFNNMAELYDFIENEARKRVRKIVSKLENGVSNA